MKHKINVRQVEGLEGELLELDTKDGQPVLRAAVVSAFAAGLLSVLVEFGLPISESQQDALVGFAPWAALVATAVWAWRKSWSGKTVGEVLDRQLDQATRPEGKPR